MINSLINLDESQEEQFEEVMADKFQNKQNFQDESQSREVMYHGNGT